MILRVLKRDPEKMIPVAMALVIAGLAIVMLGVNWPRLSASAPHPGTDWNDFVRGVIFGFGIALEIAGVALAARAAALKRRRSA
jgi:hypothetical protein